MKKRREVILGLFAAVATAIFTLGLAEVGLRVLSANKRIYSIEMAKYARELTMPDPLGKLSHVHRPGASASLMGAEIALNHLGNRGPEPDLRQNSGVKHVLVLGSSVTFGWGLPFEQVFTQLVADRLNRERPFGPFTFEFENAGIANYNTEAQYQLFLRQYPVVKPELVVLHYFIGDAEPRSVAKSGFLVKTSYLAALLFGAMKNGVLDPRGGSNLFEHFAGLYGDQNPAWQNTLVRILAISEQCQRDHIPFLAMIIPDFHNLGPESPYGELYSRIEKALQSRGIAVLNTFRPFQVRYGEQESQLWITPGDPHPNALGHALMAELLYQQLVHGDLLHPHQ